ncbi:MAG: HIT family protein [Solirubrobacterales bacterium]|nr:HIT family protein [Solirubrobacterales bacterium]
MAADPDCTFCAILAGDLDAEVVFEDEQTLAFLDHRPLFAGHVLLVTREHHETIEDLPGELVEPLFANAKRLAGAVREAMGAQGSFVALNNVVSQSVPHLHIHVVPRNRKDGLRGFFWPRNPYEGPEQMAEAAAAIRERL